ncbi:FliH/SctL family protein [uncultured Ferrovibrio sp.]|jgi:flagellar assembly protein FliH|uniref:FliH/SctL family protein n=1 Tax=uncultured Ferrovibrio sp. TaxID=1576913 RepID=UPI00260356F5|nr:FliH/SctL family protein [uncultured Ferrovibrio sp.]
MANKAKFLFDTPFDGSKPRVERSYAPKPPPPKFSAEELEAAKAAAYAEGEAAGRAAAYGEHQQALEKALQGIAVKLSQLAGAEERSQLAARIEAVEVATAIARKLAGRLIERQPLDRIEALVLRCMDDMRDEPRLVVRAAEPVIQLLDQRIDQLMAQSGFGGKLVLVPDETMALTDCRIDWADGSAERKQAVLEQDVDQAVERYVAGLQAELAQLDG